MKTWRGKLATIVSTITGRIRHRHQVNSAGMIGEDEQELRERNKAHDLNQTRILEDFLKKIK